MRHRWRILVLIVGVGIVLGIAVGGIPIHHHDSPLKVVSTTTTTP